MGQGSAPVDAALIIAGALASIIATLLTLLAAKRLGLTNLQKSANEATERLVSRQNDRIALLEKENGELRTQVAELQLEKRSLLERVDRLEKRFIDQQIEDALHKGDGR